MTGNFLRHVRSQWMGAFALPVGSTATWGAAVPDVLTRSWTALSAPSAARRRRVWMTPVAFRVA
jgi:hypothetical protein